MKLRVLAVKQIFVTIRAIARKRYPQFGKMEIGARQDMNGDLTINALEWDDSNEEVEFEDPENIIEFPFKDGKCELDVYIYAKEESEDWGDLLDNLSVTLDESENILDYHFA